MSHSKFTCPQCDQHLEADDDLAGSPIPCPACGHTFPVPGTAPPGRPAPPVPPPEGQRSRVRVNLPASSAPATPASASSAPASSSEPPVSSPQPSPRSGAAPPDEPPVPRPSPATLRSQAAAARTPASTGAGRRVVLLVVALVIVGGAAFLLWRTLWRDTDADLEAARPATAANPPGEAPPAAVAPAPPPAPVWTLDLARAKIPGAKAAGFLAGTNFAPDAVTLITGASTPVLAFRQGGDALAEREILIYLRPSRDQPLEGGVWTLEPAQSAGAAQVIARWREGAATALRQKSYPSGIALRLELGQHKEGALPGRIYLALPTEREGLLAGEFNATIRLVTPSKPAANSPYATPTP